MKSKEQSKPL